MPIWNGKHLDIELLSKNVKVLRGVMVILVICFDWINHIGKREARTK